MEGQPNRASGNAISHEDWIPESFDLGDDDSVHWHLHPVEHGPVAPFYNDPIFHNPMQPNALHDTSVALQEQLSHSTPPNAAINDDPCDKMMEPQPSFTDDKICLHGSFQHQTHQLQQENFHNRGHVYHPLPTTGSTTVLPSGFVPNQFFSIQVESAHQTLSGFIPETMNLEDRPYNASTHHQQSQFITNIAHEIQPQLNMGNREMDPFSDSSHSHLPLGYSYFHKTTDICSPPVQNITTAPNRADHPYSIDPTFASHNANILNLQWPNTAMQFITPGNAGSINQLHRMEYTPSIHASLFGNHNSDALRLYHAQNNIFNTHNRGANFLNRLDPRSHTVNPNHPFYQLSTTNPFNSEQHGDNHLERHGHGTNMEKQNLLAQNIGLPARRGDPRTKQRAMTPKKKKNEQPKCNGEIIRRLIEAHGPMNIFLGRGGTYI